MRETTVYRTASGMIFRVSEGGEAYPRGRDAHGRRLDKAQPGIVGLRVKPDTVRLTPKQVLALPS